MKITFKLDTTDFKQRLKSYSNQVKTNVGNAIADCVMSIEENAKKNLSANHSVHTGVLVGSIHSQYDPSSMTGKAFVDAEYAPYVEYGTAPHVIKIKDKKVLSDGKSFFGKEVHHPGNHAKPFFGPACDEAISQYKRDLKDAMKE